MSERIGYYNRLLNQWLDSAGNQLYDDESKPYIVRREELTFELNVMTTDNDGLVVPSDKWATGGPYTYRWFIDNDFLQYQLGTLQTAISAGAITEIKIENLDVSAGVPLSAGRIVLSNTSGDSEVFSYTGYTEAAGVYTFTVSATAAYSYSIGDVSKVVEPALIEVANAQIDQTDKDTGKLIVTMDADNAAYIRDADAANGSEVEDCKFELQVFNASAKIVDVIQGTYRCLNLMVDDFADPPAGDQSNFYTKAQTDALVDPKMPKLSAGTVGNAVQIAADGETLEDAGVTPGAVGAETVKVSANDTTADYLENKLDSAQFEVVDEAADESLSIKDDGLTIAKTTGLQTALDAKADATALGDYQPKDLSAETVKAVVDGTEGVGIDDSGTYKATTVQAIANKVALDLPDVDLEHGITTPASSIDNDLDGDTVTAQRTKDTAPSTVILLNHMDGVDGGTTIEDDGFHSLTVALEGSPQISTNQEYSQGFGTSLFLPGAAGYDVDPTQFAFAANEFAISMKGHIADGNKNDHMTLFHLATDDDTAKVVELYLEGGFLKYRIGTNTGSGEWTDSDSREVVVAGYLNPNGWNNFIMQRNADELQVGMNGYVLMRLDMTSKTLNTPDAGSRARVGYAIDAVPVSVDFFVGYLDEVIVLIGDKLLDITTGEGVPTTYTEWVSEQYVTKKYDLDPNPVTPVNVEDFLREWTLDINLKTTGDTQFYTVPSGKVLFIDKFEVVITARSTVSNTPPEITFGTDADDDAFVTQQALDASMVENYRRQVFEIATDGQQTPTDIQFSIKVAGSTGDAADYKARVSLVGYLIDA